MTASRRLPRTLQPGEFFFLSPVFGAARNLAAFLDASARKLDHRKIILLPKALFFRSFGDSFAPIAASGIPPNLLATKERKAVIFRVASETAKIVIRRTEILFSNEKKNLALSPRPGLSITSG